MKCSILLLTAKPNPDSRNIRDRKDGKFYIKNMIIT